LNKYVEYVLCRHPLGTHTKLDVPARWKEVEIESIREKLARAADTGYRMWHNA